MALLGSGHVHLLISRLPLHASTPTPIILFGPTHTHTRLERKMSEWKGDELELKEWLLYSLHQIISSFVTSLDVYMYTIYSWLCLSYPMQLV